MRVFVIFTTTARITCPSSRRMGSSEAEHGILAAKSIGMFAYPMNNQNADQQLKDDSDWYGSAKHQARRFLHRHRYCAGAAACSKGKLLNTRPVNAQARTVNGYRCRTGRDRYNRHVIEARLLQLLQSQAQMGGATR
jgi:hypothetical protein